MGQTGKRRWTMKTSLVSKSAALSVCWEELTTSDFPAAVRTLQDEYQAQALAPLPKRAAQKKP